MYKRQVVYVGIAMGIGATINIILEKYGIKFPAYLMGMVVAAIMRNIIDASQKPLPFNEIGVIGNISLSLFLSMALMSMKLWELVELAGPLSIILLAVSYTHLINIIFPNMKATIDNIIKSIVKRIFPMAIP